MQAGIAHVEWVQIQTRQLLQEKAHGWEGCTPRGPWSQDRRPPSGTTQLKSLEKPGWDRAEMQPQTPLVKALPEGFGRRCKPDPRASHTCCRHKHTGLHVTKPTFQVNIHLHRSKLTLEENKEVLFRPSAPWSSAPWSSAPWSSAPPLLGPPLLGPPLLRPPPGNMAWRLVPVSKATYIPVTTVAKATYIPVSTTGPCCTSGSKHEGPIGCKHVYIGVHTRAHSVQTRAHSAITCTCCELNHSPMVSAV
jgi:hypothetical protein